MTKKAIALFLLLALALPLLSSCKSDGGDKESSRTVEVTNRYRVVPFEAPEGYTADTPYAIDGKIYIRYYQGNYNEDQKNRLYVYDQTGAVVEKHELTVANPGGLYYTLIPSDDGAYYTVDKLKIRKVRYDGTPIFEVGLSEAFGFTDSVSGAQLLHREGLLLFMIDCSRITSTGSGGSVAVNNYNVLFALTESGEAVNKLEYRGAKGGTRFFLSPDGKVMFCNPAQSSMFQSRKYYTVNTETWKAEETAMPALPADANKLFRVNYPDLYYDASFSNVYTGYYRNDVGLFGYNNADASELLVNWTNSDLLGKDCDVVSVLSPDAVLCVLKGAKVIGSRINDPTDTPVLLIKMSDEEAQSRTVLTLAVTTYDSAVYEMVVNFNRSSEQYRVVVDDYSVYNSVDNSSLGEQRFDIDLASGVVHDIVYVSARSKEKYIAKGAFADLYAFFDADETLSRESLIGCVRQSSETDGRLFVLPLSFQIYTLAGKTALVGESETLTINDLRELQKKLPSDGRLFLRCGRLTIAKLSLQAVINEYIDYRNASCSFTDQSFIDMLEFMKALPEEGSSDYWYPYLKEDEFSDLRGGKADLLEYWLLDIDSFVILKYLFGDDAYTIKGYPNNTGNGSIINCAFYLAVSEKSAQKEGAWEFLKYAISAEAQMVQTGFPVTNQALSDLLNEYLSKYFYVLIKTQDKGLLQILDEPIDDFIAPSWEEVSFTREDADEITRFLNEITFSLNYDQTALTIIMEEIIDYFGGTRNARQCAENIQNRVSIYLSEQN